MLLHEVIANAAAVRPGAPALVWGDRIWSFAELDAAVVAAAGRIAAVASPGERIAVVSDNHPDVVIAMYAAPAVGVIVMFGNTRLTAHELGALIDDVDPVAVFASPDHLDRLAPALGDCRVTELATLTAEPAAPAAPPAPTALPAPAARTAHADPDDTAWIIHTSGTTGLPKGACLTHRSLLAAVLNTAMARPLADDDVYLFPFPLFHVAAYNVIHAHLRGRPVVLVARFDAAEVAALIERHRVTNISLAPTMIAMLLDHPAARRHDLSSLRVVAYGASAIPLPLLRRGLDELGCGFAQGYGMTELSGNAVFLTPDDHRRAAADRPDLLTAAGRPGPLAAIRLADDGEIEVRADQVIPGYWNRPDATADAFTADGWFRTGDIGRIDAEGYLSIVDRAKDIIVTGGENVASREVEDALAAHPDIAAVAVVGVAHPQWGEQVVAVATAADGATIDADAVLEWARGRLAGFKRPKALLVRDALPVNASGKVLKRDLRVWAADQLAP